MARKVPKIVFEIWGNFRFSLIHLMMLCGLTYLTFFSDIIIDLFIGTSRSKYKPHSQPGRNNHRCFSTQTFVEKCLCGQSLRHLICDWVVFKFELTD